MESNSLFGWGLNQPRNESLMHLAICIAIKNRSCLIVQQEDPNEMYKHIQDQIQPTVFKGETPTLLEDGTVYLTPLPSLLRSLIAIKRPTDNWSIVIVDYGSTDINIHQLCLQILEDHIQYSIVEVTDYPYFDRGGGLDLAAQIARRQGAEALFFCDADMYFTTHDIFDRAYEQLELGKIYYPICFSFTTHTHEFGYWRESGFGMLILQLDDYFRSDRWKHNKSWGWEDRSLHDSIDKSRIYRDRCPGYYHQWHPNTIAFKTQQYPLKEFVGAAAVQ